MAEPFACISSCSTYKGFLTPSSSSASREKFKTPPSSAWRSLYKLDRRINPLLNVRMWALLLVLFLQSYFDRSILEAEDARLEQPAALLAALKNPDARIPRLAVRAIGRLERSEFADSVRPLLASPDANVRMETVNA